MYCVMVSFQVTLWIVFSSHEALGNSFTTCCEAGQLFEAFQLDGQGPSWRLSLNRLMTVYSDQSFGSCERDNSRIIGESIPCGAQFVCEA